jgi:hypothetical protein
MAFGSAALVVFNDLWLKRHHPGVWSGKLSDVGLCVFLPLFIAAALEYGALGWARVTRRPSALPRVDLLACAVAVVYFTAIKAWPAATHAHVAWLSALVPRWRFRAVTDPTDLLCLPAVVLAWRTLRSGVERPRRPEPPARARAPSPGPDRNAGDPGWSAGEPRVGAGRPL